MSQIQISEYEKHRNEKLYKIITEKHVKTILQGIINHPKSARRISTECNISLSTVYRRLGDLIGQKLFFVSGIIDSDGKKYFLYQSRVKKFSIQFDKDSIEIEIIPNQKLN